MIVRVHQLSRVRRDELAFRSCRCNEGVVFPDLDRVEFVRLPPLAAVAERGAERVVFGAFESPPAVTLDFAEAHSVVAGDGLAGFKQSRNLVSQSLRPTKIIVIPMRNEFGPRAIAAEISLITNSRRTLELQQSDLLILRNQIANAFAVRQYQQFSVRIRLLLEAPDRLREPLPAVPGQTQTRHETVAAYSPRE